MGRLTEAPKTTTLLVRMDRRRKAQLRRAAELCGLSISDYVRSRMIAVAQRDIEEAETGVLRLSRSDQIAFWHALQNPPPLTKAQRALGALMRSVR